MQTTQEKIEAVEWLENDAAYLRKQAQAHQTPWIAERIQENAEHSARWAAQLREEVTP